MEPQTALLRLTAPVSARVSEPGPVGGPRVVFAPCSLQVLGVAEPQAALAEPSVVPAAFVVDVVVVVVVVVAAVVVHGVVAVVLVQEVVGAVQVQLQEAGVAVELPDVVVAVVVAAAADVVVVVVAHGVPQVQQGPGGAPVVAVPY